MSDASEVKRVWISFGEHGDCTNEQDWEVDEPALTKRFGEDKFYTYYAFRKMENGVVFVLASDHDRIVAEKDEEIARLNRLCQIMFDPENQPPQYTTEEAFKLWKDGAL